MKTKSLAALTLAIVLMMTLALASCGPNQQKVKDVQTKYAQLTKLLNEEVTPLLGQLESVLPPDTIAAYNSAIDDLASLSDKDANKMSNQELDTLISEIDAGITTLQNMKPALEELAGQLEQFSGDELNPGGDDGGDEFGDDEFGDDEFGEESFGDDDEE